MERANRYSDCGLVGRVLPRLPRGIARRLDGVDYSFYSPSWIGLHEFANASHGRSYDGTSHVAYPGHQSCVPTNKRKTTVLMLGGHRHCESTLLHELGHALDEALCFDRPKIVPMDWYAATNRFEAFATAFQAWCTPTPDHPRGYHHLDELRDCDPAAVAFFDMLAEG